MGNSLQDQLLKAGLASEEQARKAKTGKAPKKRSKKDRRTPVLSDSAQAARRTMAEKAERDRALNQKRAAEAERNALEAQVRQLIEQNRVSRDGAEISYHFVDNAKVRKLFVTPAMQEKLSKGQLAIVRLGKQYDVVSAEVAEKIRARDASCVVAVQAPKTQAAEEDPYKDFPVPDDLIW